MHGSSFIRGLLIFMTAIGLGGCGNPAPPAKIALMLARGGLGDKAFNDSANQGLQAAAQEFDVTVKTFDYQPDAQAVNLRQVAQAGYDFIIGLGSENAQAFTTVAAEFPDTKFALIDATADGANITSLTFSELEGDFLAGTLAAMLSKTGKVGYLGGADVLVIRRIQYGFEQGVKYENPEAEIMARNIGGPEDYSGFAKPAEAQKIAAQMYAAGADIIYAAAGGSTLGAIDAAKSAHQLIITTGSDQRYLAPQDVVTSRTKNMNIAVYHLIDLYISYRLNNRPIELDYKSGGVGFAPLSPDLVPATDQTTFEAIQADLESGKLVLKPYLGR